ncbi:MAG: hypothetical protein Q7S56_00555 [Nanoarchaeota archaeon]|nr:hypothetical protein [Nanoarchaeota archaeon]
MVLVVAIVGVYFLVIFYNNPGSGGENSVSNQTEDLVIRSDIGNFQYYGIDEFKREDGGIYYKTYYNNEGSDGNNNWVEVYIFDSSNSAEDYLGPTRSSQSPKEINGVTIRTESMYNSRIRSWSFDNYIIKVKDSRDSDDALFEAYLNKYS